MEIKIIKPGKKPEPIHFDDEIAHQAICPACHKWVRRSEPLDE